MTIWLPKIKIKDGKGKKTNLSDRKQVANFCQSTKDQRINFYIFVLFNKSLYENQVKDLNFQNKMACQHTLKEIKCNGKHQSYFYRNPKEVEDDHIKL